MEEATHPHKEADTNDIIKKETEDRTTMEKGKN